MAKQSATSTGQLFRKWRRWLERIYADQVQYLLVSQHFFQQLITATKPYAGRHQAAELAEWMRLGYIAYAGTTIRRMVDKPRGRDRNISLVYLLEDLKQHHSFLTFRRFRQMYREPIRSEFAERDFQHITRRKGAQSLSVQRIELDIRNLRRVTDKIRRFVNKAVAHTEEDRRRIPRVTYDQVDGAVTALRNTFERYYSLINGSCPSSQVLLDQYDISADLQKVWPPQS